MKKTYTKKQIQEAINYWKCKLNESMTLNETPWDVQAINTLMDSTNDKLFDTAIKRLTEVEQLFKERQDDPAYKDYLEELTSAEIDDLSKSITQALNALDKIKSYTDRLKGYID